MKIYYINLAARPDRRTYMQDQLARLGLAAERMEAITPADLTEDDRDTYCNRNSATWLGEAELSCSYSHINTLKRIAEGDAPHGLILEDDACLSSRLPEFLDQFDADPPPFDIVKIETTKQFLRIAPASGQSVGRFKLRRSFSWSGGTAGYIVTRKAASVLFRRKEMLRVPADIALFTPNKPLTRLLTVRLVDPGLCIQANLLDAEIDDVAPSDLTSEREARSAYQASTLPRRVMATVQSHLKQDFFLGPRDIYYEKVRGARKTRIPFLP